MSSVASSVAIARLEQRVDGHDKRSDKQDIKSDDHEKRIRDMEKANLKLSIQMGAIFSGITLAGTWLIRFLH